MSFMTQEKCDICDRPYFIPGMVGQHPLTRCYRICEYGRAEESTVEALDEREAVQIWGEWHAGGIAGGRFPPIVEVTDSMGLKTKWKVTCELKTIYYASQIKE